MNMPNIRRLLIPLTVCAAVALSACGGDDEEPRTVPRNSGGEAAADEAAAPIDGTTWTVSEATAAGATVKAAKDAEANLTIKDGKATGTTGCNGFGGKAEVADSSITFSQIAATKKACMGDDVMNLESAMLAVLNGEVSAEVSGNTLTLTAADDSSLVLTASE